MGRENLLDHSAFGERFEGEIARVFGGRGGKTAFARAIGRTKGVVSTYCKGVIPDAEGLLRSSKVLGVSVDYLLKGPDAGSDRVADLPPDLQQIVSLLRGDVVDPPVVRQWLEWLHDIEDTQMRHWIIAGITGLLSASQLPGTRGPRRAFPPHEASAPEPTE
jgi:transcriptional regulator with XRE-family HTH domain